MNFQTRHLENALVIGASGMLGSHLYRYLKNHHHKSAIGTAFSHRETELMQLDIRDFQKTNEFFKEHMPSVVFIAGYFSNVEACEKDPDSSAKTNVQGIKNVLHCCLETGTFPVFYSSDYVFDGNSGPYAEDATAAPVSVYGKQKLEIEQEIQNHFENYLIIRITGVFGLDEGRKNFLYGLINCLGKNEPMRVPRDQIATPGYAPDIAEKSVLAYQSGMNGILHIACDENLSRSDFALKAASVLKLDPRLINPVDTSSLGQLAKRPLKGGLRCDRLEKELGINPLSLDEAILDFRDQLSTVGEN